MSHDFLVQWPIIFLRRYKKFVALFFLLAGNKEFQRGQMCSHTHMLQMQMRRNEHGTYSTHTARGFSILYYVFSRKQFILCSALRISVALHYSMLHRFEIFFYPWNNRARLYQAPASQPRVFARLLVDNNFGVVLNNDYVGPSGHLLFQTSRRLIYVLRQLIFMLQKRMTPFYSKMLKTNYSNLIVITLSWVET